MSVRYTTGNQFGFSESRLHYNTNIYHFVQQNRSFIFLSVNFNYQNGYLLKGTHTLNFSIPAQFFILAIGIQFM